MSLTSSPPVAPYSGRFPRRHRRPLGLILFLLIPMLMAGQPAIRFDRFNWEQGLSQNTVTSVIQDRRGYIWAGTQDGLNRYDGYRFHVFKHDPEDAGSLVENNIWTLFEDAAGHIWVGTFGGLSMLDPETGRFTNYRHDPEDETSLGDNIIKSIFEDRAGNLWVGASEGGLSRLDRASGRFTHYRHRPGDPGSLGAGWVWAILEDSRGVLWVATTSSLCRLDRASGRFTHVSPFTAAPARRAGYRSLFEDRGGRLWIGATNGLYAYDRETGAFTHFAHDPADAASLSHNEVWSIRQGEDGALWIATRDGLNLFDGRRFRVFRHDPRAPHSLSNNYVNSVLIDRAGDLWAGTMDGLNRQDRFSARFGHLLPERWNPPGSNLVFAIAEDAAGSLWLGTIDGLIRRTADGGRIEVFRSTPGDPAGLSSNFIWDIARDAAGRLWVAAEKGGVRCLDPAAGRWIPCPCSPAAQENLDPYTTYCILADSKNNLWFGTEIGLFRCDGASRRLSARPLAQPDTLPAQDKSILTLHEDRAGMIWLGGFKGVRRLNPHTGEVVTYAHDPRDSSSLSNNTIYAIHEDRAGTLWIGTGGGGLNRLDRAGGRFRHFREKQGLPNDVVNQILEDDQGRLWLSTNRGIACFDPATEHFRNWDTHDGLQSNEFNFGAGYRNPATGVLYFGGVNGLNVFHPDSIRENAFPPPVVITGFRRYNANSKQWHAAYPAGLSGGRRLVLHHRDDILEFEVAGLSFQQPVRNQYAYRLRGLNDEWIFLGNDRKITFTNLPPGPYTLRVRAANNDGVWDEKGISLDIQVRPPWWLSAWAKLLYAIAAAAVMYLLFRWNSRAHRKKIALQEKEIARERRLNEKFKQIDLLKDQFLANTSHELRTPLQGIIGLSESLFDREDDPGKQDDLSMIISSGKRLSSLVNDILDFSKLKNSDIRLARNPVDVRTLVDIVLKNNAPLVMGKDLRLINAVPADLPAAFGDENRLQQVLYNLVGNAIKFTESGHVRVDAREQDGLIRVAVTDTGIGIPANKQEAIFREFEQGDGSIAREFAGTGLGLSISRRLVELHGGQLWLESTAGAGTTFFFTLPPAAEKAATPPPAATPAPQARPLPPAPPASRAVSPPAGDDERIRILVVDDEPINHQVLKNHLSAGNVQLVQAMNGEEALKILGLDDAPRHSTPSLAAAPSAGSSPAGDAREGAFDLVLLDIMMPRMSGYEVCRRIREMYLSTELPVIMITAKDQLRDVVQGLSLGANDYLAKPFHKDELLARIRTQLDLHRVFEVAARFVPNAFLRSLNRERITEVALGDYRELEVTVLFSDIRDYTALAETMTPEENFKFVRTFHGRMGPVIQEHGGFVNQYLGDAIMAIFPHGPRDALRAAIGMQQRLGDYNRQRLANGRPPIRMGAGFHTGSLIMGIIGDRRRMDAATIADTVNTASRIESLTKYYGASILLSEDSLQGIKSEVGSRKGVVGSGKPEVGKGKSEEVAVSDFRYLGPVLVKGKKEPVGIYECFGSDEPDIAALKRITAPAFEQGLRHFFAREFPEAVAALGQVLHLNPADQAARLFLDKSERFLREGVPADWTGVEVMTFK